MDQIPIILGGLVLAGILWLVRSVARLNESVAVLRTQLVGEAGDGGLTKDVRGLRQRTHDLADSIHGALAKLELHDLRITNIEKRGDRRGRPRGES